ncbi:MAG: tetratricopeptide repeat protein [Pseudomonadota bacterium]
MARKVRVSKKKIPRGADEFVSTSTRVFNYVAQNQRNVLLLGVAVLVAALLFAGWRFHSQRTEKQASNLYYEAIRYYHGDNNTESSVTDDKERCKLALGKLQEVIGKYPRTGVATLALLYSGHTYYKLKQFDESIEFYQSFLKKTSFDNPLKIFAFDGLGYGYEAKGDYRNALIYFSKLIDGDENPLSRLGHFSVGRCYEKLGEKDKALQTYQKVLTMYPDSGFDALAREKISILKR